jgi:hypothetical protein
MRIRIRPVREVLQLKEEGIVLVDNVTSSVATSPTTFAGSITTTSSHYMYCSYVRLFY